MWNRKGKSESESKRKTVKVKVNREKVKDKTDIAPAVGEMMKGEDEV